MNEPVETGKRVAALATALGACAAFGGFLSLLGWPLDIPRLTDWFNGGVSIQPNTCVLITLSGAAVMLVQWRAWRAVGVFGALVALAGLLILTEHLIGADFGIDHHLLFGRTWGREGTMAPGRMGPPASTSFTLVGIALLLLAAAGLRQRTSWRRFVPALGIAVCVIAAFSLLGYLYGAEPFYTIPSLTAISLQTSIMFFVLGVCLVLSVPERDPLLMLIEDSGAGALARIAIPALVVMIPLVMVLRVWAYEAGLFDLGTGRAFGTLVLIGGALTILWVALTTLRRREQALRETDRRKDEFLAALAHELRNPLTPVMNSLWILDHAGGDQAIAAEARATMWRQMRHMVRLIDDLLDVARISRGSFELRKENVNLQEIIQQTVAAFRPLCEAAQQEISVELPAEPLWARADPVRVAQILGNLLSNASRYSDTGGRISIRAGHDADGIAISVQDSGIGIPPDKLEFIFEMFSQLDRSAARTAGGLGIGLYLVRRMVEMHGGRITAHSDGAGLGSTMIVWLPLADGPDAAHPAQPQPQIAAPAGQRILVVDDNADAANTMATLLDRQGYVTETADDGYQAVEVAARFRPDIVLLDIGLPGMNGYEVARRLRLQPEGGSVAIVAVTGWGQEEDRRRAGESGCDAHLVKPVDPAELFGLLAALARAQEASGEPVAMADPG